MKKKHLTNMKKTLSVFMAVLMLMTAWVWVAPEKAAAAAPVSATETYNKSKLNEINTNVDYNVDTTGNYYKFKIYGNGDDGNDNTKERQLKYYKNLLSHDGGTSLVGDNNRGSYFNNVTNSELTVTIAYPTMVLKYDGVTTPKFGIMLEADASKNNKISFNRAWMDANSNGLSFNPNYWMGIAKDDSAFFYIMEGSAKKYLYAQDTSNGDQFSTRSNGQWEFLAASLEFTGSMSIGEWTRAISPTWKFYNGSTTYTGTNNSTIYVMNFKGYGELLTRINNHKADLLNNAGQYTTDSIKQYVDAAKAITNLNPKNYTGINSAASWGSQMNTAYTNYNNAVDGLKKREYEITYDNMFSLADWRYSQSYEKSGVSVDLSAGKVTVKHPTSSGEYTTNHSGSASNTGTRNTNYYAMPVVGGQEYTFKYTTDGTDTEMFAFFYDKNGGCTHAGSYGAYCFTVNSGTGERTFKAPDNSTQMEIRFDNNKPSSTANFWDIMIYPAAVKTENEVDSWTNRPHRQLYSYGASVGTLQTPVRPGYIFDGWKEDTDGDGIGDAAISGTVTKSRVLYSTWKLGTMDVGYDNLFSLSALANSNSSVASNTSRGSIAYDLDAGTITAITTKDGEVYSNYGSSSGHYQMAVEPNTEYIFTANVDLEGSGNQGQMFVFFYDASGNGATGAIQNGSTLTSPHIGNYVTKEGFNYIAFTTPANCTKMSVRFGATVVPTTATYSNIGFFKKSAYDSYAKDYEKVREAFTVSETKTLLKNPTRAGYVFNGWEKADGTKLTSTEGLSENTTVYAKWTKLYTVTFYNGDNTTVVSTKEVKNGETVGTLPEATKAYDNTYHYGFTGWSANDTEFTADTKITSDLNVYPNFSSTEHTLVWSTVAQSPASCAGPAKVEKYCNGIGCQYTLGAIEYTGDNTAFLAKQHNYSGDILDGSSTGNTDTDTHSIMCLNYTNCGSVDKVPHTWHDVSTSATCSTKGSTVSTCPCGAEKTTEGEIDPDAHNFDDTVITPNNDGETHSIHCTYNRAHTQNVACTDANGDCKCDVADCGQELTHKYDQKIESEDYEKSPASCTEDAVYYYACKCRKVGTETWTKEDSMLQHNWTATEKYLKSAANCTDDEVYYKECSLCKASSKDITNDIWTKANTKWNHKFEGDYVDNNNGTHDRKCVNTGCNATGATVGCAYGEWSKDNEATHSHTCTLCGYTPAAENHDWTKWETVAGATNTAAAQQTRKCNVCDRVETISCVYETTHKDATCTAPEITTYKCKDCGHGYTVTGKAATGHDYTDTADVKSNGGSHSYGCTKCDTYGYEDIQNAAEPCDYGYTKTTDGQHKATCKVCKYSFTENCVAAEGKDATCSALAVCGKCNKEFGSYAAHNFTAEGGIVALGNGEHAYRCENCKDENKHGVDANENESVACSGGTATCTTPAACEVCGQPHGEENATAHVWDEWKNVVGTETHKRVCKLDNTHTQIQDCLCTFPTATAPDCNTPSYTINTCDDCGHEWQKANDDALGHDWSGAWVKKGDGTHTKTCARGCAYADNTHKNDCADAEPFVKEATCTEGGYTAHTCDACGYNWKTDPTAATGHSYNDKRQLATDTYKRSDKSCTTDLTYWYVCDNCDVSAEVDKDNEKFVLTDLYWMPEGGAQTGHDFTEKSDKHLANAATCTEKADYYYECQNCDAVGTATYKAGETLGHEWVHPAEEDLAKYNVVKADCVTDATYYYVCNRDGCGISSQNVKTDGETWTDEGSRLGHDFDHAAGYTAYKAADCFEDGVIEHWTCETCGKKYTNEDGSGEEVTDTVLKKLNHLWETVYAKSATCEEAGYTKHNRCTREGCNHKNSEYEVIPATGHEFLAKNDYFTDAENGYHAFYCSDCDAYGVDNVRYEVADGVVKGGIACSFDGEYVNFDDENGVHYHKQLCVCGNEKIAACTKEETEKVEVTCTEDGYYKYTCGCGFEWTEASEYEADKAKGHAIKIASNGNGTHTEFCENCDYTKAAEKCTTAEPAAACGDKEICDICKTAYGDPVAHSFTDYVHDEGTEKCQIDGTKTAKCDNCDATDTVTDKGSALEHKMTADWSYDLSGWTNMPEDFDEDAITEPTCHTAGKQIKYCTNEGCAHYVTQTVKADETLHRWKVDAEGKEVWDTVSGDCGTGVTLQNVCTVAGCGEARTRTEEAGHAWETICYIAPTCGMNGYKEFRCTVCGEYDREDLEKTEAHSYVFVSETPATCASNAYITEKCTICNGYLITETEGTVLEHKLVDCKGKAASCEIAGYTDYQKCSDCGAVVGKTEIPAAGHGKIDGNGKCKDCGRVIYDSESGASCGCICHKESGLMKLIYKILNFFWKLFKISESCECGNVHW